MKKTTLLLFLLFPCILFSQVSSFLMRSHSPSVNDLNESVTVHVMIKDFCDDSKPFKKVLMDNWKLSKLSFDYNEDFDAREEKKDICPKGEWYMYISHDVGGTNNIHITYTTICIGRNAGGKKANLEAVISIPLIQLPADGVCLEWMYIFKQDIDVQKNFLNLSNEYYLKNMLQIMDQLKAGKDLNGKFCAEKKEVLANTLYIPDYVFLKTSNCAKPVEYVDHTKYMKGFEGKYSIATNDQMVKLFQAGKPFYYLLFSGSGNRKYHFIVEGISGQLMGNSSCGGYNIGEDEMEKIYKDLIDKDCK